MPITIPETTPVQEEQPARLAVSERTPPTVAPPEATVAVASAVASPAPLRTALLRPSAGSPAAKAAPPVHGEIDAVFTYSADSWTEVYDATGRRLLYGLSNGPATRKLEGVPPLSVMLGDASGVTIEVGGRAASISRFVRADHTAHFLIAADGSVLAAPRKKGG
jgi:cytoskeleton protein RodZ